MTKVLDAMAAGDDRCGGPLRRWRHAQPTQGGLDQFTRASS